MFAFPVMLIPAAEKAGMAVPDDTSNYEKELFPHFHVFCVLQLCRPMQPGEHWNNAEIIAKIPVEKLKTMPLEDFRELGFEGI